MPDAQATAGDAHVDRRLPTAHLIAAAVGAVGLTLTAAATSHLAWHGPTRPLLAAGLTLALAGSQVASFMVVWNNDEVETHQADEALWVPMALVLPPAEAVVAFAVGITGGILIQRRWSLVLPRVADPSWGYKLSFNAGQEIIAAALGVAVLAAIAPAGAGLPLRLAGVLVGGAVFVLVNHAAFAGMIKLVSGAPFRAVFNADLRSAGLFAIATLVMGILIGLAAITSVWTLPFALANVAILQVASVAYVRARLDQHRLEGLLAVTGAAHQAPTATDVRHVVLDAARRLARARDARIGEAAPRDDQLGARLGGNGWLVVAERKGSRPFDAHDQLVLDGLAAIGTAATEAVGLREELRRRALHDALTGLPNRRLFDEAFARALAQAHRHGLRPALLFVDLDGFKAVNDTHGHDAGDALLTAVAERLQDAVRASDLVARLGGDEFVVLLPHVDGAADAEVVAAKICQRLRQPVPAGGAELAVTPSVGIAVAGAELTRPDELLARADQAMYDAKHAGGNAWRCA